MAKFEESLQNLRQIVERLEQGEIEFAEALRLYKQGLTHSKDCRTQLEQAELEINQLQLSAEDELEAIKLDQLPSNQS